MEQLPQGICVMLSGYSEKAEPNVIESEMERGPVKRMIRNSRVLVKMQCSLRFNTAAQLDAFEAWFFGPLNQIGFFEMEHPRTKQTIQARFEGGSPGTLTPLNPSWSRSRRDVVIEYYR